MNAARLARALESGGFPHDQALALSESLAEEIERTVATRDAVELAVSREVQALRTEMHEQIGNVHGEIESLRAEMHREMAALQVNLIKWMVGLMVGQLGLILVLGNLLWAP